MELATCVSENQPHNSKQPKCTNSAAKLASLQKVAGDVAVTVMSRVDAEVVQLVYSKVQQHVHPRLRRQWKELARIDLQSAVVTNEI